MKDLIQKIILCLSQSNTERRFLAIALSVREDCRIPYEQKVLLTAIKQYKYGVKDLFDFDLENFETFFYTLKDN
jgi:hypothetical protein